jgi:uncharacterized delta-60 repeat protein
MRDSLVRRAFLPGASLTRTSVPPRATRSPKRGRFPSPRPAAAGSADVEALEPRALLSVNPLDTSFSGDGKVASTFGSAAEFKAVLSLPDGKVLAAGTIQNGARKGDFLVARYTAAGALDTSFGGGTGRVFTDFGTTDDVGNALALVGGGKFVVVGTAHAGTVGSNGPGNFAVARYNADGALDTSFSGDGKVTTDFNGQSDRAVAAAVLSTGKLLVVGDTASDFPTYADYAIARYNTNGTLDTTFSGDGKVISDFGTGGSGSFVRPGLQRPAAVAVLPNDKFLIGGSLDNCGDCGINQYDFSLARYNANGTLDGSFGGGDGWVKTDLGRPQDVATAMAVQRDGKVVLVGSTGVEMPDNPGANEGQFGVVRYNANGTLDSSDFAFGEGIYTADLNPKPGPNSASFDLPRAVVVQPNDKILVAGTIRVKDFTTETSAESVFTLKLGPTGVLEAYSTNETSAASGLTHGNALAFTTGGKAVIAGSLGAKAAVIRLAAPNPATASIAGLVFNDKDGDGVKDANENVLAGWRVFVDSVPDGVYTPGEATAVTGSDGKYKLTGLAPGTYRVREVRQDPYVRTLPGGAYPLGYYDVGVAVGQAVVGKNFGNRIV